MSEKSEEAKLFGKIKMIVKGEVDGITTVELANRLKNYDKAKQCIPNDTIAFWVLSKFK